MCGSDAVRLLFKGTDRLYGLTNKCFDIVRCTGCGLIRQNPLPSEDELRLYYPDSYWFSADSTAASKLEQLYRCFVLRDHLIFLRGMPGPALDVGCGGGLLLSMLRERGVNAFGLDSALCAANTAVRSGVPVVCGSLDKAPFPAKSFRLITMYHVLEHVPDPGGYLQAARGLLAHDGRLVVQVPNATSWQARLFGGRWNGFDVPRHLHTFHESDLTRLLNLRGFKVTRRRHFSLRDNPTGLATSITPRLDPMARLVRGEKKARLAKDLAYLCLTLAVMPFAATEAAFGQGSTVMVEAIKRE
jgi:2-polyprenyl-3-methyl-5-hydroxy-6-metoxy-1,4-benzoquinol methylase